MKTKLLVVNACGSAEGDVNMLLLSLANFNPELFEIYAVTVPRGKVHDKLMAMPHVKVIPMELGGSEASLPGQSSGRSRRMQSIRAVFSISKLIRRHKINVVYTIDRTVATHIAAAAAAITHRPFILASVFPSYPNCGRLNRLVLRQATKIHIHSEFLRPYIEPYAAKSERVVTITLAIQLENYNPAVPSAAVRADLGLEPETPLVLLAGRLSPYKGHEDMIKAALIVHRSRPDTHFIFAGRDTDESIQTHGPQATSFKAILEQQICEANLQDRVRLVGYYPDLPGLIAAANVSAMPSWEEPFGLVALEGMAMEKPVVATRAGGVPEFVIEGETGLLVPPRDPEALAAALLELINDPVRARAMGKKGRQKVEQFHQAHHYNNAVADLLTQFAR